MIADYHTHTALCKHAEGEAGEYVARALRLGLDEIGCSEHIPMPHGIDTAHRMSLEQYYSIYAPNIEELRERYRGQIRVRKGIEADFFAGTEEWAGTFIKENDFDYVIGSVHFLGEWGFDSAVFVHEYAVRDIDATYIQYFETVRKSARSGLFDIVGHCDLIKKFGHRPTRNLDDVMRETMKVIKENDLCVEINTSGLRKPVKEMYPSESILNMIKELRIPLTLGSDAHSPGDVGKDFERAIAFIEEYGRGRIAVFEKRERRDVAVTKLMPA